MKLYRKVTGLIRLLPNFIIIGGQRCGTTSLYHYLIQHPCVVSSLRKEVHFFDLNFKRGINWYRSHFPLTIYPSVKRLIYHPSKILTGEASPYYIFHPLVPKRIIKAIPKIKLIVLLRNPIDRAYSHYNHERKLGYEKLSFEDAIYKEEERLSLEKEKILKDENYYSMPHRHYSYLSRGIYVDQLKTWFEFFKQKDFLIIKSEDFYQSPEEIYQRVLNFLSLPELNLPNYTQYNQQKYPKMNDSTRKVLCNYFKPHNEKLFKLLNASFDDWNQ